jgi:hypothetical protein
MDHIQELPGGQRFDSFGPSDLSDGLALDEGTALGLRDPDPAVHCRIEFK